MRPGVRGVMAGDGVSGVEELLGDSAFHQAESNEAQVYHWSSSAEQQQERLSMYGSSDRRRGSVRKGQVLTLTEQIIKLFKLNVKAY